MSLPAIEIPALQAQLQAWENKKYQHLLRIGTSFVDHFDTDHCKKVLEAKEKIKNQKQ